MYPLWTLVTPLVFSACPTVLAQLIEPQNPYQHVDWASFADYRADLHVHTIQSDGCHFPDEVIRVYHEAGFSILSITDHDTVAPNLCPTRDRARPQQIEAGVFTERPSPYPDPRPATYPANTTWPWTDFGARSPSALGMVGIEGSELTCGHHRSAFFVDYGAQEPCAEAPTINAQLREVAARGGLAFINHPEPRVKEWYCELYRDHSAQSLVGIELAPSVEDATAIWDQLLADLMPNRPIWGFATSDMHSPTSTPSPPSSGSTCAFDNPAAGKDVVNSPSRVMAKSGVCCSTPPCKPGATHCGNRTTCDCVIAA